MCGPTSATSGCTLVAVRRLSVSHGVAPMVVAAFLTFVVPAASWSGVSTLRECTWRRHASALRPSQENPVPTVSRQCFQCLHCFHCVPPRRVSRRVLGFRVASLVRTVCNTYPLHTVSGLGLDCQDCQDCLESLEPLASLACLHCARWLQCQTAPSLSTFVEGL